MSTIGKDCFYPGTIRVVHLTSKYDDVEFHILWYYELKLLAASYWLLAFMMRSCLNDRNTLFLIVCICFDDAICA